MMSNPVTIDIDIHGIVVEIDANDISQMTFRDLIMKLIMEKYLDIPILGHRLCYIHELYSGYAIVIKQILECIPESDHDKRIGQSEYFDNMVKFGVSILGCGQCNSGCDFDLLCATIYENLILKHPISGAELKLPYIVPRVMTINLMINQLINNYTIPIPTNNNYYIVERDNKEIPLWYSLSQGDYKDGDVITLITKKYIK